MLADILPFITKDVSSDAASTRLVGEAFDLARKRMHDNGQPEIVLEIFAMRIIKSANSGERDPVRIAERALAAIGLQRTA